MGRLHPAVVHFAIALFLAAVVCDILARLTRRESLHGAARWNLYLAALAGAAAVGSGLLAEERAVFDEAGLRLVGRHELLAFLSAGLLVLLAAWRLASGGKPPERAGVLFLLLALVGVALISATGFLGGEMVFSHGIGVEPMMEVLRHGAGQPHP